MTNSVVRGRQPVSSSTSRAAAVAEFFSVVHVAARQLPHPAAHDEPVPAHHQHTLACIVEDYRHRAAPHPEDVLREPHVVRKLDIGQAHADVRGVVHADTLD
jgi:hypothetical protein